ncbi:hypothetical protein LTR53_004749 [Teratosphaeriaceae sp. CCFEE 6253]|nr:hypothetical protein LTR53_004749 [Teratosphaeriaceae sp. CCFEE 6253]
MVGVPKDALLGLKASVASVLVGEDEANTDTTRRDSLRTAYLSTDTYEPHKGSKSIDLTIVNTPTIGKKRGRDNPSAVSLRKKKRTAF